MSTKLTIPLDANDALAVALGRLLGHWAVCEHELMGVLSVALGIEIDKARFIWQAFQSATGKIELLQKVNLHFTKDPARQDALNALLKIASGLNSERNGFVHALWADTVGGTMRIKTAKTRVAKRYSDAQPITAAHVQVVVDNIARLSASLNRWSAMRHGNA